MLGLMSVRRHSSFKYSDEEEAIRRLINTRLFVALHMSVNVPTAITVCTFTLKETLKMSKFLTFLMIEGDQGRFVVFAWFVLLNSHIYYRPGSRGLL